MTHRLFDPLALNDGGLGRRSIGILRESQVPSGAFVASPNFPTYHYSWLRDGAFCARALDLAGEHARAAAFHRWVERAVRGQRERVEFIVGRLDADITPGHHEMLPARYTLDGQLETHDPADPWPNYQLDGYGTWLWGLREHLQHVKSAVFDRDAVELVARYLVAAWKTDCCDCWEEFGDGQHASTLAAVVAGLSAAGELLGRPDYVEEAERARKYLLSAFCRDGAFRKGATDDRLDASLLWLALPFGVVDVYDPMMQQTVQVLRTQVVGPGGGVYRYRGDTYYGGGQWILLTCWLAWYDAVTGQRDLYEAGRRWVVAQASTNLDLPEQVVDYAQSATMVAPWVGRWGPVATPLLWSHAMYLIMSEAAASWK